MIAENEKELQERLGHCERESEKGLETKNINNWTVFLWWTGESILIGYMLGIKEEILSLSYKIQK